MFSIGHLVASRDDVDTLLAQAEAAGATSTDTCGGSSGTRGSRALVMSSRAIDNPRPGSSGPRVSTLGPMTRLSA
jgi:hypothetical protein